MNIPLETLISVLTDEEVIRVRKRLEMIKTPFVPYRYELIAILSNEIIRRDSAARAEAEAVWGKADQ